MTKIRVKEQTEPATPASGCSVMWIDSSSKTLKSKDSNGTIHDYGLSDATTIEILNSSESTHLLSGCQTEVNGSNAALFDISAGKLIFSDAHINPSNPTVYLLNYTGSTGNVTSRLADHDDSLVTINKLGVVNVYPLMNGTDFSKFRDEVAVGILFHTDHVQISYTTDGIGYIPVNLGSSVVDLAVSVGIINLDHGNTYLGSGMSLNKSEGYLFQLGFNKPNYSNPNVFYNPAQTPSPLSYIYCDGADTYIREPLGYTVQKKWDNAGTLTNLGANEWTIQYLYFTGLFTAIQYGQHKYNSMADAMAAINVETLSECPELPIYASFRGWMVISGSTTDLSNPLQCYIAQADKFGTHVITGGLATNSTTLQGAYNNSIEPEIKITPARGAVTIQDADTPTGGNLIEVKNSGGSQTILKVAADRIEATEKFRLSGDGICYEDLKVSAGLRPAALLPPDFAQLTGLGNVYLWAFDLTKVESLYATVQLPHAWKQGTNIVPHIHWTAADGNAGNIVWGIEYTWANMDGTFSTTTVQEITAANSTAYYHHVDTFPAISGSGKTVSSILMIRLFRNGASASDTYGTDAYLLDFDLHYQIDSLGSETLTTKTN